MLRQYRELVQVGDSLDFKYMDESDNDVCFRLLRDQKEPVFRSPVGTSRSGPPTIGIKPVDKQLICRVFNRLNDRVIVG